MWQSWGLNSFTIMGHFLEQVSGIGKLFLVSINFWGGKLLQKEVMEVADTLSSLPHENGRKMQSWEYLTARESALLMWTESISHQILLARLGWKTKMILKSCLQGTNQSVEPLLPLDCCNVSGHKLSIFCCLVLILIHGGKSASLQTYLG